MHLLDNYNNLLGDDLRKALQKNCKLPATISSVARSLIIPAAWQKPTLPHFHSTDWWYWWPQTCYDQDGWVQLPTIHRHYQAYSIIHQYGVLSCLSVMKFQCWWTHWPSNHAVEHIITADVPAFVNLAYRYWLGCNQWHSKAFYILFE